MPQKGTKTVSVDGKVLQVPADATPDEIDQLSSGKQTQQPVVAPQPSLWDKVKKFATSPLVHVNTDDAQAFLDAPPSRFESEHPYVSGAARGLVHGGVDVARATEGLSSPIGLGTMAATTLTKAPLVRKIIGAGSSALFGGQNASDLADTSMDDRPWSDPDKLQRGLNDAAGITMATAGGMASTKGIAPKTAGKVMNTALGTEATPYIDPGAEAVKAGVYGGKKSLLTKITAAKEEAGQGITPVLDAAKQRGTTVNMQPSLAPVKSLELEAAAEQNPSIANAAKDYVHGKTHELVQNPTTGDYESGPAKVMTMDPLDATTFKRGLGRKINWEGEGDPHQLEGARREAHGIAKEAINTAVPDVKPYNDRYAGLTEAENALEPQVTESGSTLGKIPASPYVIGSIAGAGTGLLGGNATHMGEAALLGTALTHIARSPSLLSRIAYHLGEQEPLPAANPPAPLPPPQATLPPGQYPAPASPLKPPNALTGAVIGQPPQMGPATSVQAPASTVLPRPMLQAPPLEGEYMPMEEPSVAGPKSLTGKINEGPFAAPASPLKPPAALPSARGRKLSTVTPETPITLYHGTNAPIENLQREGLRQSEYGPWAYATPDPDYAATYGPNVAELSVLKRLVGRGDDIIDNTVPHSDPSIVKGIYRFGGKPVK